MIIIKETINSIKLIYKTTKLRFETKQTDKNKQQKQDF